MLSILQAEYKLAGKFLFPKTKFKNSGTQYIFVRKIKFGRMVQWL